MADALPGESARVAHPSEIEAVAELAREARREALGYRGGERWLATEAADEPLEDYFGGLSVEGESAVFVGLWNGAVVGYGGIRRLTRGDGTSIARIEELFVDIEARSVGVGEALFNALLEWAQAQGVAAVDAFVLPGHRAAKNFFETFGMVAHALIMHTQLDTEPVEHLE